MFSKNAINDSQIFLADEKYQVVRCVFFYYHYTYRCWIYNAQFTILIDLALTQVMGEDDQEKKVYRSAQFSFEPRTVNEVNGTDAYDR